MNTVHVERNKTLRKAFIVVHLLFVPIPALAGALDVSLGSTLFAPDLDRSQASTLMLDSTLRYYGGFWLGAVMCLLWALRDVPARARQIELLWAMIFVGGIGRVIGFVAFGRPPASFIGFAVIELLGPPLFVLWLRRAWPRAASAGGVRHLGASREPAMAAE